MLRGPRPEEKIVTARGLSLRAVDASRRGAWADAKQLFEQALQACPVDVQTRKRYAESLWLYGDRTAALEQMKQAVRLSARSPDLLVAYGQMLLQSGQVEAADRIAGEAANRAPMDANALALRGDVWMAQGRWDEALEIYHRALKSQPDLPRVQLAVARIDYLRGRPLRCLATLSTYLQQNPTGRESDEALWLEGLALRSLDRQQDALVRFENLAARGARSPELLRELAEAKWQLGDRTGARAVLADLQRSFPTHPATGALTARMSETPVQIR